MTATEKKNSAQVTHQIHASESSNETIQTTHKVKDTIVMVIHA